MEKTWWMSKMEIGTPLQVMVILILIFNPWILFVSYGKVYTVHTLKPDECQIWCLFASWFFYKKPINFWFVYFLLLPIAYSGPQPHGKIVFAHLLGT